MKAGDFTVIALSNWAYRLIALNWALHMKRLNIENYLVYCLDESIYEFLRKRSIRCDMFQVSESNSAKILSDTKTVFKTFSRSINKATVFDAKMLLFKKAMAIHKNFVYSDLDAIWLKNILPLLVKSFEHHDILLTGNPTAMWWSPSILCAFKDSDATRDFIIGWYDEYFSSIEPGAQRKIFHDQSCINFMRKKSNGSEDIGNGHFSITVGKTKVRTLGREVIPYYFYMDNKQFEEVYAYHTSKGDGHFSLTFGEAKSRTLGKEVEVVAPFSLDSQTFKEMYIFHTNKKETLLHKDLWTVPWITTFRYITFDGILYFLSLRAPFFGAPPGQLEPRFLLIRVFKEILRPPYRLFKKIRSR